LFTAAPLTRCERRLGIKSLKWPAMWTRAQHGQPMIDGKLT
jgi:hypothetical protein